MKQITITTQKELDELSEVKADESVTISGDANLELNANISVYGFLSIAARINFKSSRVEARGSSSVEARESSRVEAWESSSVVAWGSSRVEAWESSSVEARESSRVVARGSSSVKKQDDFFVRDAVPVNKSGKAIVYKRVSEDFKTQENTANETIWTPGTKMEHPSWNPVQECGGGKFHACSRPYFCDEFRSGSKDRYVAIEIKVVDTHQFKNPSYPHEIAFRRGKVLYECDRFGDEIEVIK